MYQINIVILSIHYLQAILIKIVPNNKWPSLVDKRFPNWIKNKFTDAKYKPKKWREGEDACACEKCKKPRRTGPWKGDFCKCDAKTFHLIQMIIWIF